MLTSALAGITAFVNASPPTTWPRTTLGYLRNWRASYFSGMANGTTQYLLNTVADFNPQHVSCRTGAFISNEPDTLTLPSDPQKAIGLAGGMESKINHACTWDKRIEHVVLDTVATRRSTLDGRARLVWPSPRLAGAFAGAYGESPWEPSAGNSTQAIFTRAGESLIVPAIGALFTEYPGLIQLITKPLHKTQLLPKWSAEATK